MPVIEGTLDNGNQKIRIPFGYEHLEEFLLITPNFNRFVKESVHFSLASDLSKVPELPGIYAWHLPLNGDSSSELLHYLKELQKRLESAMPATEISAVGKQHLFNVSRNPPSFNLDKPVVQRLAEAIKRVRSSYEG